MDAFPLVMAAGGSERRPVVRGGKGGSLLAATTGQRRQGQEETAEGGGSRRAMGCGPPLRKGVCGLTRHGPARLGWSQVALPTSLSRGSGRAAARPARRYVPARQRTARACTARNAAASRRGSAYGAKGVGGGGKERGGSGLGTPSGAVRLRSLVRCQCCFSALDKGTSL